MARSLSQEQFQDVLHEGSRAHEATLKDWAPTLVPEGSSLRTEGGVGERFGRSLEPELWLTKCNVSKVE